MKRKVLGFISTNKKYSMAVVYALTVCIVLLNREILIYSHIAFIKDMLTATILDIFLVFLILLGLVCVISLLRCPPWRKHRFQKAVERASLYNGKGEFPILKSIRTDIHKPHGVIYVIKNVGLSPAEFDNKTARLETVLNGKIYGIEYGRRNSRTLLYFLPRRYVKPTVIDSDYSRLTKEPNMLVVGKTASGKSYTLSAILGIYTKHIPDVSITVCDYKKSSFAHFADTPNFYGYEDVPDGIRKFYAEFSERLEANDDERNKHIRVLLIDEYGALISAQDKKTADELKTMVGNMLFMGRSLGIRVLIGVQRADSEHFKAGAREQFRQILALGNLSKEQKSMLFTEYKEQMNERNGTGEGYLLIDGQNIERVKVAEIKDFNALNDSIRKAMNR